MSAPDRCRDCGDALSDGDCQRCAWTCAHCGLLSALVLSRAPTEHLCALCAEEELRAVYTLYGYGWHVEVTGLDAACEWLREHIARTDPRSWDATVGVTRVDRSDEDHDGLDEWERAALDVARDAGRAARAGAA